MTAPTDPPRCTDRDPSDGQVPTVDFSGCGDKSSPRRFDPTYPRGACPYGWCGDGTKGCRRAECIAHAAAVSPAARAEEPTPDIGALWALVEKLHDAVARCAASGGREELWAEVRQCRADVWAAVAALERERDEKAKEIERFWTVIERIAEIIGAEEETDLDIETAVQMYVDWANEKVDCLELLRRERRAGGLPQ